MAPMPATGSAMAGPHGIQPVPNSARRRATRRFTVPLTQMGTPLVSAGFGLVWMSVKESSPLW